MKREFVVDLYRALLRLLPRAVREEDEAEIADAFRLLWLDACREQKRVRALRRGFGGLLIAFVVEWWNQLWHRAPRAPKKRRDVMDGVMRHVRQAMRSLLKTPSFALSTVLLLGLGVGSVTTIFTIVDHVLLRPLAYPHADRLFVVRNGSHSGPVFEDLKKFHSADAWAASYDDEASLTGSGQPRIVREARISRDFFSVFGARPARGRLFVDDDFQRNEGAVLSAGAWKQIFGGDSAIVGRSIVLGGAPVIVIGVLDDRFVPPESLVGSTIDIWRPIDATAQAYFEREAKLLSVAGRVAESSTLDAVEKEADELALRRAQEYPDLYLDGDFIPLALPIEPMHEATVGSVRLGLAMILGAVTLLLLIACTNVAHLFMARGLARVPEMATRRVLGARMGSLVAQLMVESLLVGAGGALLGVMLAILGVRAFLVLSPSALPRASTLTVDVRVLAFAVAVAGITALLFGLLPALRLVGRDMTGPLQSRNRSGTEGRFAHRVRTGLVVAEVALSLILVTQAGSLLRSFIKLQSVPLGFRTEGIWTLPLRPTGMEDARHGGTASPEVWAARMEAVRASLAGVPGVTGATFGVTMPLEFTGGGTCCFRTGIHAAGVEAAPRAVIHPVDANYFKLLEMRFIAGTDWDRTDFARPFPAVLSEPVAIALFGSAANAIGREITIPFQEEARARVTGVVASDRHYGPANEPKDGVYVPAHGTPVAIGRAHFAVRIDSHEEGPVARLREAVWRAEPDLPAPIVRPLGEWASAATARARFQSLLLTTFASVALLLVAGGLYGTLLYSVGRRRREMGIRLALGDAPARLERRVLSQGVLTTMLGGAIGLAGVWGLGRVLQSSLFENQASDPVTMAAAMGVLLVVTVLASWLPARRAAGTDPMEALRTD